MTPLHDEVFFEIDSARKLLAEFKLRPRGGVDAAQDPAAEPGAPDDAAQMARREEDAGLIALAKERSERREKDRAEARADASEKAYARLEAKEVLRELADARAKELAAAEESIRKACEKQDGVSGAGAEPQGMVPADPVRYMWFPALGASQVWYFSAEGERRGPVTFANLRKMAATRVLDPRLDMVWKKGMPEWEQAGLIDGLFERNAIPEEVVRKPTPRHVPAASLRSYALMEKLALKNLHWPGINRSALLLGVTLFPVLWSFALPFGSPFLGSLFGPGVMGNLYPILAVVPLLVVVLLILNRLMNLGMSRWWSFALVVPLLNLWVAFRCLFCPPGYAYHRRMDRNGLVLIVALCLIAPCAWFVVLNHPAPISGGFLQAGVRSAVERAGEMVNRLF